MYKSIQTLCVILLFITFLSFPGYAQNSDKVTVSPDNTLTVAIQVFPDVFIPVLKSSSLVFSIGAQVFAGLTRYDEQSKIIPYLAKSWNVSQDSLTYTFSLRDDAFFHDGQSINADDVIFSIELSINNHPFAPFLSYISKVTSLDDKTVQIHLTEPLSILPKLLTPIFVPILPKHVYDSVASLTDYPISDFVGSGPFYLKNYEENQSILLAKNTNFFLPNYPKLDYLEFKVFLDTQEILYALLRDDIDIVNFFSIAELKNLISVTAQSNGESVWKKSFNFYDVNNIFPYFSVLYNLQKPLFKNRKVREAFSLGVNLEQLAQQFNSSYIQPMYTPISPISDYSHKIERKQDIAKANVLLDEAGYKKDTNGKRFSINIDYANDAFRLTLIRWLQNEFSTNLGVEIKTRKRASHSQGEEHVLRGDFDLFLDEIFSWNDPLIGLHRLYYSKNVNKKIMWSNNSGYQNDTIDALLYAAGKENNEQVRQQKYNQIQEIIAEDYASLWLLSNHYVLIASKKIHNLGSLHYSLMSPLLNVIKTQP